MKTTTTKPSTESVRSLARYLAGHRRIANSNVRLSRYHRWWYAPDTKHGMTNTEAARLLLETA